MVIRNVVYIHKTRICFTPLWKPKSQTALSVKHQSWVSFLFFIFSFLRSERHPTVWHKKSDYTSAPLKDFIERKNNEHERGRKQLKGEKKKKERKKKITIFIMKWEQIQ